MKNNKPEFLISFDPEAFLCDAKENVKSSIPILQRDKYNPIILDKETGTQTFSDNLLLEFSFNPSKTKNELINKYRGALQKIQNHIGKKYRILAKSAHICNDEDLVESFGVDPKIIGCSKSLCFRKKEIKDLKFEDADSPNMRSGSNHLHISSPVISTIEDKENIARLIEIFLGMASVIWDKDPTAVERRKVYGRSGEVRYPEGEGRLEARFLSNYVMRSPELIDLTYDLTEYALSHMYSKTAEKVFSFVNETEVENAINNCDRELAKKVLKDSKLPKGLLNRVMKFDKVNYSTKSLYKNWQIKV